MAKAIGIASQARGKVGNVIYYLTKNRAGQLEQTVKSYQPVVANPQSYAQALARVPVGPVQRVCSALLPLIQRGFEGTSYGEPSKSEFLSYNLKYFRGPFMEKGSVVVPPGPMLISKGSLSAIGVNEYLSTANLYEVLFTLAINELPDPLTRGSLSRALLDTNSYLSQGEQLTFVIVRLFQGEYIYNYESLYLDPSDTSPFRGILQRADEYYGLLGIALPTAGNMGYIAAAACIRSQAYGESSFRRSTAFLEINPNIYLYNDDVAVRNAVASYRTGEDPEDWEDDPTPEYQQLAYLCMVNITEDMVQLATWPFFNGRQCLGYVTKGGEMGVFYTYSNTVSAYCLCNAKGEVLSYQQGTSIRYANFLASYQPSREYSSIYGTM